MLDSMLERMKSEKTLNIFEFVQQLREERVFMVQSLASFPLEFCIVNIDSSTNVGSVYVHP